MERETQSGGVPDPVRDTPLARGSPTPPTDPYPFHTSLALPVWAEVTVDAAAAVLHGVGCREVFLFFFRIFPPRFIGEKFSFHQLLNWSSGN